MSIVAYVRVSSKAQDDASQRAAILRQANARGDVVADWYAEKRSGRTIARPELERLRGDVRAKRVSRIYVFRLDRLGRSGIRDILGIIEELREHRCELISVADGFSLDGPAAEVVVAVIAWAAKVERQALNERIASARERLETEGRSWGRPSRLNDKDRAKALSLRERGMSVRQIAMSLGVPKSTIARALSQNVPGESRAKSPESADAGVGSSR